MLMAAAVARLMLSFTASYPLVFVFLIQAKLPLPQEVHNNYSINCSQVPKEKKNTPVERDERFCARLHVKHR